MNNKGMSIVELLAALVIMSIVASLLALLISTYQDANQSISESSKASIEATLLIQSIKSDLEEFSPTNYELCVEDNCIILTKSFAYVYNQSGIELEVYDPVQTNELIFENQSLSFGGNIYIIDDFVLADTTSITYQEDNQQLTIFINFTLVSETNTYNYTMSYSFDILDTPQ